jgi:hypothetical protein
VGTASDNVGRFEPAWLTPRKTLERHHNDMPAVVGKGKCAPSLDVITRKIRGLISDSWHKPVLYTISCEGISYSMEFPGVIARNVSFGIELFLIGTGSNSIWGNSKTAYTKRVELTFVFHYRRITIRKEFQNLIEWE